MKSCSGIFIGLLLSVSVSAESLLEGRVRLESGQPVADAQVQLFDLTNLRQGAIARAMTDGTGYFALPLAAPTGGCCRRGSRWGRIIPIRSIPRRLFLTSYRPLPMCAWRCLTCWDSA